MKPAIPERYLRSDDFAAHIDNVTFAPEVWGVFAKLDQPRNTGELAELLQFDLALIEASFQLLLDHKLIRKHVLSWRDYAAAAVPPPPPPQILTPPPPPPVAVAAPPPVVRVSIGKPMTTSARVAPPPPPTPAKVFPAPYGVAATPEPPPPPAPKAASTVVSFRLPAYRTPTPRVTAAVSLRLASPGNTVKRPLASARDNRWRLSPVLKAIGAKAGGGLPGQLLIYRVFLHVSADLMRAGGLHSFGLHDDHLIVAHAPLRAAIAEAAKIHAELDVGHLLAA